MFKTSSSLLTAAEPNVMQVFGLACDDEWSNIKTQLSNSSGHSEGTPSPRKQWDKKKTNSVHSLISSGDPLRCDLSSTTQLCSSQLGNVGAVIHLKTWGSPTEAENLTNGQRKLTFITKMTQDTNTILNWELLIHPLHSEDIIHPENNLFSNEFRGNNCHIKEGINWSDQICWQPEWKISQKRIYFRPD